MEPCNTLTFTAKNASQPEPSWLETRIAKTTKASDAKLNGLRAQAAIHETKKQLPPINNRSRIIARTYDARPQRISAVKLGWIRQKLQEDHEPVGRLDLEKESQVGLQSAIRQEHRFRQSNKSNRQCLTDRRIHREHSLFLRAKNYLCQIQSQLALQRKCGSSYSKSKRIWDLSGDRRCWRDVTTVPSSIGEPGKPAAIGLFLYVEA